MISKRSRQQEAVLDSMERQLDRIHTALLVRDPGTPLSVDAYEGLRKQVVASATARLQHVAQLAEIDVALRRGASPDDLRNLVDQWLRMSGVERVEDPTLRDVWEPQTASVVEVAVEIPAYVDSITGRVVRQGRLKPKPTDAGAGSERPSAQDIVAATGTEDPDPLERESQTAPSAASEVSDAVDSREDS